MSRSSNSMRPLATRRRPKIALNTVDLPAPFGPITVVIAPRATLKLVPCSTVSLPYPPTTPSSASSAAPDSVSKVCLDDPGVAADRVGRPLGEDAALCQHQHARAERHDELHVVLDDDEGGA